MSDPNTFFSMLATVFGVAEGALDLNERLRKALKGIWPDSVVKSATECLFAKLTEDERKIYEALPIDAGLHSIKAAIKQDIAARAWTATPKVLATIAERDWRLSKARADDLGKAFESCLKTALVRLAPDAFGAVVIADQLGVIEELLEQALKRPPPLSISNYEPSVRQLLHDYLSEKYPFVGRKDLLEKLTELALSSGEPHVGFVLAEAGRGKTALLAHLFFELTQRHADEAEVIFIPISHRYRLSSKKAFFERLYSELASIAGRDTPPAGTDPEALRQFALGLMEESAKALAEENRRLVIILDALDEAADFDLEDVAFPPLPKGLRDWVRFILSARPTPTRPTPKDWLKGLGFEPRHAFTPELPKLSREDVREALAEVRETLPALDDAAFEKVANELYQLTDEGDPLLLRLFLESLSEQNQTIPELTPEELARLEPGLEGFFDTWLRALEKKLEGEAEAGALVRLTVDLLTLLSYAKEALEQEELYALLRALGEGRNENFHPYEVDKALEHAGRFLTGPPYALQHPRLSAYFQEKYGEADTRYREAFLVWGEQALKAARDEGKPIPGYLLRQLSAHLADEGKIDRLAELVVDPTWYRASTQSDPSRSLLARDIDRLLDFASSPKYVHTWVTDVFFRNVLRAKATNYPVAYFGALAALGRGQEALDWIRLISDPEQKALALAEVAEGSPGDDYLLIQIIEQLSRNKRNYRQDIAYANVISALAKINPERAVQIAEAIEVAWWRALALTEVAKSLTEADPKQAERALERAMEIAEDIESAVSRKDKTLAEVAKTLAKINPERAISLAEGIEDIERKTEAFIQVAESLTEADPKQAERALERAMEIAEDIESALRDKNIIFFDDILRLATHLVEAGEILLKIDTQQAKRALVQAAEILDEVADPSWKAPPLIEVAKTLAKIEPERAVEILEGIEDTWWKAYALAEVAKSLAEIDSQQAQRTLERAGRIAEGIGNAGWKAEAFIEIAKALIKINPQQAKRALEWAFNTAKDVEENEWWLGILIEVAKTLAKVDLKRAMKITDNIQNTLLPLVEGTFWKVWSLVEVAKTLLETNTQQAKRALKRALTVAEDIEDAWWKAGALAKVVKGLAKINSKRALKIAEGIEDPWWRADTLVEVAKTLAKINPARAMSIAEGIENAKLKTEAFIEVAKNLAEVDPKQAERALNRAKKTIESGGSTDTRWKELAYVEVAKTLAKINPERAEQNAEAIEADLWKIDILIEAANRLVGTDPQQAKRILEQVIKISTPIKDSELRAVALVQVVKTLAKADPEHAMREVEEMMDFSLDDVAVDKRKYASYVTTLADIFIERFTKPNPEWTVTIEDLQRTWQGLLSLVADVGWKAAALIEAAKTLVKIDPEQTMRFLRRVIDISNCTYAAQLAMANITASIEGLIDREKAIHLIRHTLETSKNFNYAKYAKRQAVALIEVTRTLAEVDREQAYSVFGRTKEAARAWGATYKWLATAFPTLTALDPRKAESAYERLERIHELLDNR